MIQEKIHADMESINEQMLKKMKMNGLVQADDNMSTKIDSTMASIPVSLNRDGSFSKRSSVASRKQFDVLGAYVRRKICDIRESILDGNAAVEPYELGKRMPAHTVRILLCAALTGRYRDMSFTDCRPSEKMHCGKRS